MAENDSKTKEQGAVVPAGNASTPIEREGERRSRSELLAELRALDSRAHEGDEEAPSRIRRALEETPNAAQVLGNAVAKGAERAYVKKLCGNDPLLGEALSLQLESLRREVSGPDPSPLERLLAESVVAGWLAWQQAEAACAANLGEPATSQGEFNQRRADRLHRRYLASIRTLAQIRKLLTPAAMQVNVAERQVNVMAKHLESDS